MKYFSDFQIFRIWWLFINAEWLANFPQVFINGVLIGGKDILLKMIDDDR